MSVSLFPLSAEQRATVGRAAQLRHNERAGEAADRVGRALHEVQGQEAPRTPRQDSRQV